MSKAQALFTIWQMLADHIEERLPRIGVPTLVVRGSIDPLVSREWAEEIARVVPYARLVEIPGGAHALNLDSPLELARAVQAFVTEAAAESAGVPRRA